MRYGAKSRGNVKAEVKRNGKGEMKNHGHSTADGIERARVREESKMRG